MDRTPPFMVHAPAALRTLRVLWAAMLSGQLIFLFIIFFLWSTDRIEPIGSVAMVLFYVSLGLMGAVIPLAYFVRNQIYKRNWQADAVTPAGYAQGNLLLLVMLEGVSMFALVATLLNGRLWPTFLPAVICLAFQVINFPTGAPMQGDRFASLHNMTSPREEERR
jgi:hypothetical protein